MSWTAPKPGLNYRVKVFFVDDTYWDDGNRTTSRSHDFATLSEAVGFKLKIVEAGSYPTTSSVTGEPLDRAIDADDVNIYKWRTDKPQWGWLVLKDDAISMLGDIVD